MNHRRMIVAGLVLALLLAGGPTWAQDDEGLCSLTASGNFLDDLVSGLQAAKERDFEKRLDYLRLVNAWISSFLGQCSGLDFEGAGSLVSDVVFVPPGAYRATLVIEDENIESVRINYELIDGLCDTIVSRFRPHVLVSQILF